MKQKSRLFTGYDLQKYAPVFLMLVLMLILTIANKNFLTGQSIYNLLSQVAALGIVALGSMLVLLTAGIDFTAGFGLSLAGVTAGVVYISSGDKGWVLVLVSVLTGAVVGLLNGLIIVGLKLNPFIATLAMMTVCKGISMMVSEGRQVQITSPGLLKLGSGKLFGFLPIAFILFAAVIFIIYLILNKTKLGIYTYAIGGNEDAVAYSGINKDLYKVFVYVTAGVCYGIAAIITCSQVTIITSNISGDYLLDGIASAIVGGTSLLGGKGRVSGTVIGAFIITLITTILNFLQVPFLLREVIKGLIIVGILVFNAGIEKLSVKMEKEK
ncbi:MAG TPA: ABC transporter permease [Candidatus Blautia ornithocaccae]|nr:ABC transporter permease [Candidatus Blautia ornithocaccae]